MVDHVLQNFVPNLIKIDLEKKCVMLIP